MTRQDYNKLKNYNRMFSTTALLNIVPLLTEFAGQRNSPQLFLSTRIRSSLSQPAAGKNFPPNPAFKVLKFFYSCGCIAFSV